jgi:hypothetical protein
MTDAYIENVTAFTEALGLEWAPAVLSLAIIPWRSPSDRDEFIEGLVGSSGE